MLSHFIFIYSNRIEEKRISRDSIVTVTKVKSFTGYNDTTRISFCSFYYDVIDRISESIAFPWNIILVYDYISFQDPINYERNDR